MLSLNTHVQLYTEAHEDWHSKMLRQILEYRAALVVINIVLFGRYLVRTAHVYEVHRWHGDLSSKAIRASKPIPIVRTEA